MYINDHFTKTGSVQTVGKLTEQERPFLSQVAFVGTPLPWRQAVKVVISLYCLVCPFAFVQIAKYATPAVSFIFALLIFSIEEVAVEIEDPFGRTYPVQ
jgi:predicted membrane chloride channel (bestrophin family)